MLVFLFFGRLESSKSIPMKPRFVNAGVDLLLLQKILSFQSSPTSSYPAYAE